MTNFCYTVDPMAEEPIVLVNKWIGADEVDGPGIMGDQFQAELLALDTMGKKRIQVWINSPGGSVTDGYSMYNAIIKSKTKVDTYCVGIAASMAGVLFQAGRKRIMADYGMLMYHNPYSTDGKKDEQLEMMRKSIITMIARSGQKTEAEIEKMMDRTTWILADEALDMGMCDEIEYSEDFNKKKRVKGDTMAMWKQYNNVINRIINKKSVHMDALIKALGLKADAGESDVLLKVIELQNVINKKKADVDDDDDDKKKNDDDVDALKSALKKAEEEIDALKKKLKAKKKADVDDDAEDGDEDKKNDEEVDKLKAKIKKAEEDKKKAEEDLDKLKASNKKAEEELDAMRAKNKEQAKVKAEADAEAFVKAGRIKAEEKAKWAELFESDKGEEMRKLVANLPINKVANKIENIEPQAVDPLSNPKLAGVVANAMHTIRHKHNL